MTSEDPSKQSLADDHDFLDSLSEPDQSIHPTRDVPNARAAPNDPQVLDGLADLDQEIAGPAILRPSPPVGLPPTQPPQSLPVSLPPLFAPRPRPSGHRARRFVDLFPSAADLESATAAMTPPSSSPTSAPESASGHTRPLAPRHPDQDAKREPSPEMEKGAGYESFYGLDEGPFTASTDPRFLYHSAAFDRAAQAMLDAIRRRDGIVMLTGELGMGKTMLCRAVIEQLDRRTLTSLVADPFVAPEDLLRTVLADFGVISQTARSTGPLARASLVDLSAALRDFLCSLAPLEAFAVVIIDEAQNLSVDSLKHIGVVADTGADEQLLQLMLVGRPTLAGTLLKKGMRPLFQRVSSRATLGPLREDEILGYLTHRLQMAGPGARVEFDAGALEELHAVSRGVPRVVNLLCDRALIFGARESASTIDERLVRAAAADLGLAPRRRTASGARAAAMLAAFALLVLLGAAAGAFVFRSDVAALVERWQALPVPPPVPRQDLAPTIR